MKTKTRPPEFKKADPTIPLFSRTEGNEIAILPGCKIAVGKAIVEKKIARKIQVLGGLQPGKDYAIHAYRNGTIRASVDDDAAFTGIRDEPRKIGGFHVDLLGNIVEHSIWDLKFRPNGCDPRGMVCVAGKYWVDIYLLAQDHTLGTSRAGVQIADGADFGPVTPSAWVVPDADPNLTNLNWFSALVIMRQHNKQLLSVEEFAEAAEGVTQGQVNDGKPKLTGRIAGLTSKWGVEQATGCLWTWGREAYEKSYRRLLGGSWYNSGYAGPRRVLYYGPNCSFDYVGARGRCDHLQLA